MVVKIALIGSGGIANQHAIALKQIEDAKVISTFDVVKEKAEALAASCGATPFTDVDEAIEGADLVYVCTPPSIHREIAVQAMKAGKHVMIEKPITISIEDAEAIVEASYKYNKKTFVGFNMRYRLGYQKLRNMYQSGKLGEVIHMFSQRMGMNKPRNNWRTHPELLSGFTIESISHDIDMFKWIAGGAKVKSVYANVKNSMDELKGYDDNTLAILNLDNGVSASIQASWSSHIEHNSRGIIGKEGTAMVSGRGTWNFDMFRYRTEDMDVEMAELINDPLGLPCYVEENKVFIDCVKNDKSVETNAEYGLEILKVSHAILESCKKNERIDLM